MPDDARAVLSCYNEAFQQHHDGWSAPINWPKDMKLAKELLETYSFDQLVALVHHYFVIDDPFIAKGGYTFGVFKVCLGKILVDYQRYKKSDAQERMMRERQQRDVQSVAEWRSLTPEQRARKLQEG